VLLVQCHDSGPRLAQPADDAQLTACDHGLIDHDIGKGRHGAETKDHNH
jgi:hypothetical protein